MPYVVHVREAGACDDTFLIPKVLRRRAEREATRARASRGLGITFDPLPLPRVPLYEGAVESWVCRIGWREYRRLVTSEWSL